MKTLKALLLVAGIALAGVVGAQEMRICFPRKGQANRQTGRLNRFHYCLKTDPITKKKTHTN